jgi:hypothetical protein
VDEGVNSRQLTVDSFESKAQNSRKNQTVQQRINGKGRRINAEIAENTECAEKSRSESAATSGCLKDDREREWR